MSASKLANAVGVEQKQTVIINARENIPSITLPKL